MKNTVGKMCNILAIIIFILLFIGGFYLCKENGKLYIVLAMIIWAGGFIFCLMLFALGEIINLLHNINISAHETSSEIVKLQMITQGTKNEIIRMQDVLKQDK